MGKTCQYTGCKRGCYGSFCILHKRKKRLPVTRIKIKQESDKAKAKRLATKRKWLRQNPPNQFGQWECYLKISKYCLGTMDITTLTLEHVEPKVKAPEKKYDIKNIKPSCSWCNKMKGSQSLEKLSETYPHLKADLV